MELYKINKGYSYSYMLSLVILGFVTFSCYLVLKGFDFQNSYQATVEVPLVVLGTSSGLLLQGRKFPMRLLDILVASSIPIVEVLLVTAIGAFLAIDRVNILGEDARKHLNNIVFYVFSPPLIGTNLAQTITLESAIKLWFMPLNILLTFIIGSAFGWIVIQVTRAPSHLKGLVIGCCAAERADLSINEAEVLFIMGTPLITGVGNLGNLPLIIVPAVCKEKGSPFGSPDECHKYGMGYASLSMAIGMIYLWSYVYNLIRIYSTHTSKEVEAIVSKHSLNGETSELFPESWKEPLVLRKDTSSTQDPADQFALPFISDKNPKVPVFVKFIGYLKNFTEKLNLKKLLAPSSIGAIAGFGIGVVPQIRNLLIGQSAPLHVIEDCASLLADGAIPVSTLVMGGNLTKGLKSSGIQVSIIIGIIVARFVLLPLSGIGIVKGAIHLGLINSDPLYQFVLMLHFALPPATGIGVMTQLFGVGESEFSVIVLWTYALASVSLTLWSTMFMWLVKTARAALSTRSSRVSPDRSRHLSTQATNNLQKSVSPYHISCRPMSGYLQTARVGSGKLLGPAIL